MSENRTTVSYIGYEDKDEDAIYGKETESIPLEIGGKLAVTGLFVVDRMGKEKRITRVAELLEELCVDEGDDTHTERSN